MVTSSKQPQPLTSTSLLLAIFSTRTPVSASPVLRAKLPLERLPWSPSPSSLRDKEPPPPPPIDWLPVLELAKTRFWMSALLVWLIIRSSLLLQCPAKAGIALPKRRPAAAPTVANFLIEII